MEIGVYHEFHCRPDQTAAAAYEEALGQIEAADRWGLDAIWLAEIHQQARRSVLSAPLTVAVTVFPVSLIPVIVNGAEFVLPVPGGW